MSAPESVRTTDGVVWTLRTVTSSGIALYASKGVCECPSFVMATLAELAEHGIQSAELAAVVAERGALPVPFGPVDAGPVVQPLELLEAQIDALATAGNRVVNDEMHQHLCMCDAWPKSCVSTGNYFMGAWDVSGLEAALPAVLGLWERMRGGELETLRDRIAELESGIAWRDAERARWSGVHYLIEKAIDKGWSTLDTLDVEAELGPEVAPVPAEPVAEPSCLCPPADQPGPRQLGCPLAEVPRPPLKGRARLDASAAVAAEATHWKRLGIEDPHDSPLHHPYRLGHDLPEGCRLSEEQVQELGNPYLGGGA